MTIIIRSVFEEDGKLYPYLFLEKIDFSEGIDVNKTSLSEECMLCHYLKSMFVMDSMIY